MNSEMDTVLRVLSNNKLSESENSQSCSQMDTTLESVTLARNSQMGRGHNLCYPRNDASTLETRW